MPTNEEAPVVSRLMTLAERDRLGMPAIEWITPRRGGPGRKATRAVWLAQDPNQGLRCGQGVPELAVGDPVTVGWDAATRHLVLQVNPAGPYRLRRNRCLGGATLHGWCRARGLVPGVRYPVTWVAEDQALWVRIGTPESRRREHVD